MSVSSWLLVCLYIFIWSRNKTQTEEQMTSRKAPYGAVFLNDWQIFLHTVIGYNELASEWL